MPNNALITLLKPVTSALDIDVLQTKATGIDKKKGIAHYEDMFYLATWATLFD